MLFLIFTGIVSLIFGILFLFSPKTIRSLNDQIKRLMDKIVYSIDEKIYNLRVGVGVSLILVSLLVFFTAYCLIKRYG